MQSPVLLFVYCKSSIECVRGVSGSGWGETTWRGIKNRKYWIEQLLRSHNYTVAIFLGYYLFELELDSQYILCLALLYYTAFRTLFYDARELA